MNHLDFFISLIRVFDITKSFYYIIYNKIDFVISKNHGIKYDDHIHGTDTDSNKSFDFLLNPICIVIVL